MNEPKIMGLGPGPNECTNMGPGRAQTNGPGPNMAQMNLLIDFIITYMNLYDIYTNVKEIGGKT